MTAHDNKLVKEAKSMTAGVTASKLETGATITIHGHEVRITATRPDITTVQYANLARRTFDTHSLNGYLDLSVFPVGTAFERPTAPIERAVIEAVTGDCCYQVRITSGSDVPRNETYSYADFIAWHMDNSAKPVARLEVDLDEDEETNPFEEELKERVEQLQAHPEALQFGDALIADLRAKLEAANKAAEEAEINGQRRINELQRKVGELNADLLLQNDLHVTELLAKNQEINRLEEKAAILNPAPTRKEVCTLIQVLHIPEMRQRADVDLATKLSEDWTVLHIDISTEFTVDSDYHFRIVTLVRDLPTDQPKARVTVEATAAAIYDPPAPASVPVPRPPVRQPPQPQPMLNQTIIGLDENKRPVSRPLTFNGPKPGETKKIPTLASIQARREADNAEIANILNQTASNLETLRRQSANQPSPFNRIGAQ